MCRHNTSICATQPRFALQQFHRSSTAAAQVSHFLVASGLVLFVVAVFGLCVSWRLRRRSGDGATAERGARGCGVYGAMALVVMANVIISSAIVYRYVMQARLDVDEDLKYAMYQYFVDASSRDKLDSLHREFKCCGVKNYTDWTMATAGAVDRLVCAYVCAPHLLRGGERGGRLLQVLRAGLSRRSRRLPQHDHAVCAVLRYLRRRLDVIYDTDVSSAAQDSAREPKPVKVHSSKLETSAIKDEIFIIKRTYS
ncbi:hypothetical protein V5799_000747 [Amblyomma americanum]|uniref:Uncharacterized protein n=1 Tax=Amblyomma americanum TaxID=6943 RepID=A0AAQ4D263_AMBAM